MEKLLWSKENVYQSMENVRPSRLFLVFWVYISEFLSFHSVFSIVPTSVISYFLMRPPPLSLSPVHLSYMFSPVRCQFLCLLVLAFQHFFSIAFPYSSLSALFPTCLYLCSVHDPPVTPPCSICPIALLDSLPAFSPLRMD